MTAKTTKKRNKRFKRGEKRCFTPRYLTYKDSPKREIQEPQVLGRGHRGQRPQSSPSGERKTLPRQEYSHACPVFIRTPPRGKSKNLRFLAGVIGDSVPNRPHQARENFALGRNIAMLTPLYKDFPKREIQEPQVLGRDYRGQRSQSSPSGERKLCPRQKYSHAYPDL